MTNESAEKKAFSLPFARIALILAGLVALAAIAIAVIRSRDGASESSPTAPAEAPAAGDLNSVITGLEKKLAENPGDAEGWNLLGLAYYNVGRYADAVKAYAKASEIDPRNPAYWSALGEVQVLSGPGGVVPAAEASFEKALTLDPKDFRARYFMAVRRNENGQHERAVEELIGVLRDSPADAPWQQPVRDLVARISTQHKIDVAGRMPALAATAAPSAPVDNVVTGGIPGPTAADLKAATGMTPSEQNEMAKGMVARLAARLEANPRDADRWIMLIRSRMMLNDAAGARAAVDGAKAAFRDEPQQQARFDQAAQMLGVPGK